MAVVCFVRADCKWPTSGGRGRTTHIIDGFFNSSLMGTTFPSSSFEAAILKVARIRAAVMNKRSLLKWRPGQILSDLELCIYERSCRSSGTHRRPCPKAAVSESGTDMSICPSFWRYRSGLNSKGWSNTAGSCIIALFRFTC